MKFILDTDKRKAQIASPAYRLNKFNYRRLLRMNEHIAMLTLIWSLRFDGRFYGAEMMYSPMEDLEGILAPYGYEDPVELVRRIREND